MTDSPRPTGRPQVLDKGYRVMVPTKRRKDGQWSKKMKVDAVFTDGIAAFRHANALNRDGTPARVVEPSKGEEG